MRWFEVLAAALFTLDMTGSGLAVAVVSAARTMPMLLLGAFSGVVAPWHVAAAAVVSGVVWSSEMATRRRMVGESVEARLVSRALALDTMSNSFTRLLGPVFAGMIYQRFGLAGSFGFSACFYAFAAFLGAGLTYRQDIRRLVLG